MPRLSPRIKIDLPVSVQTKEMWQKGTLRNLSLDGAMLVLPSAPVGALAGSVGNRLLRICFSPHAQVEIAGRVTRRLEGEYAVKFVESDFSLQLKLWTLLSSYLKRAASCPFCGERSAEGRMRCDACGFHLDVDSPEYFHYLQKRRLERRLEESIRNLGAEQLRSVQRFIATEILQEPMHDFHDFLGSSKQMLKIFDDIRKVAPTDLAVLIKGESGAGKELCASAIHRRSQRREKPFVAVSCALPESLLEVELFGDSAFAGVKKGRLENTDGGTIFLNDLDYLPPRLQLRLLSFLQQQERVIATCDGGQSMYRRIIAAADPGIVTAVTAGTFNGDLYRRLDQFGMFLPPLRERGEDKVMIATYFLRKFSRELGVTRTFAAEAAEAIESYLWPGNVREVIHKVRRAVVVADGMELTPADLGITAGKEGINLLLSDAVSQLEEEKIRSALKICKFNISKAARMLGMSRPTIYSRMKRYGISEAA